MFLKFSTYLIGIHDTILFHCNETRHITSETCLNKYHFLYTMSYPMKAERDAEGQEIVDGPWEKMVSLADRYI